MKKELAERDKEADLDIVRCPKRKIISKAYSPTKRISQKFGIPFLSISLN